MCETESANIPVFRLLFHFFGFISLVAFTDTVFLDTARVDIELVKF